MRMPKIFSTLAAVILLALTTSASAEFNADIVDGVDWSQNIITVTGEGLAPLQAVNTTQAKGLAAKAARADAYRKLGEIINGVRVEGSTTVEKMRTTQDRIQMRVAATIKGAKISDENFLTDGSCRVTMQVPLFGADNSLAGALFERTSTVEPFPAPVYDVLPSTQLYNSSTPVNRRLELAGQSERDSFVKINPNKPPLSRMSLSTIVMGASSQPIKKSVEEYASLAQGNYTGLIVDCRGLHLQPVMSPVILNTNGTKIFGHKNLDPDKIVEMGMADYVTDSNAVARAGENPLVVKAVKLENFNSCPVLTLADSNRVLIENHATKFLKDLKVVFLYD